MASINKETLLIWTDKQVLKAKLGVATTNANLSLNQWMSSVKTRDINILVRFKSMFV